MTPELFDMTYAERVSPFWVRLSGHLNNLLEQARMMNDRASNTEQSTAALRGRIACLKGIVALGSERPMTAGDGNDDLIPVATYDERVRK